MRIILLSILLVTFNINTNAQKKDSVLYIIRSDMMDSIKFETDEVIVTGTRTNQKIIDIPYSVVRINSTQYKYEKSCAMGESPSHGKENEDGRDPARGRAGKPGRARHGLPEVG